MVVRHVSLPLPQACIYTRQNQRFHGRMKTLSSTTTPYQNIAGSFNSLFLLWPMDHNHVLFMAKICSDPQLLNFYH
ncbi:hypothetical protein VIGAN_08345200, partial [Vigna angularis var. angularis]